MHQVVHRPLLPCMFLMTWAPAAFFGTSWMAVSAQWVWRVQSLMLPRFLVKFVCCAQAAFLLSRFLLYWPMFILMCV